MILGLLNSFGNQTVSLSLYVIAMISVLFLWLFLRYEKRFVSHSVIITRVSQRDADMMSYIVTYLVPFTSVSFNDLRNGIALCILLAVVAILYVRSNLIYVNPILNLLGYHLFEVESEDGKVSALISRRPYLRTPSTISVISLGDYAMLEE
ncbi:hypothetical protein MUP79_00725 [Candidatus Bathyarchaeota archaeon]|nr:hypothetical protein [Candidatus Bathyarchaeota archaeon]